MKARVVSLALLAVLAGGASRVAAQATGDAKTIYEDNCRKCHGVRGTPPKTMKEKFPKIATFDSAFIAQHSADSIVKVLTKGKNEDMKSFKDKMSGDQMMDVAKYVRELGSKSHP
jgi:mono/diheme cytochrome c family protein